MSVIVEYAVPASSFVLGRALRNAPELKVELEQVVPTGTATIPYFWVIDDSREAFEAALDDQPELAEYEVVDELDDRTLYRAEWDTSDDALLVVMIEHDAVLQRAGGDAESWEFQLRFPDTETLSSFHNACQDAGVDTAIERLYHTAEYPESSSLMTEPQLELVERAYDEGYFDVPRSVTLAELADQMDVSDQAVNERLRRGLDALIEATLKSPPPESD